MAKTGIICVSVSHHYRLPSSASEVTTQGVMGEAVEILEERETHVHVRQADGYQSWIPNDQLVSADSVPTGREVLVRDHFARIFQTPSESAEAVRDAVVGSRLNVIDDQGDWAQIALPDGVLGWARTQHFGTLSRLSPSSVVACAREFLGYQYLWGGRTPKGFDCSGFVQTVFALHGVQLQRDAWQQQLDNQTSLHYLDSRPGDLLFFSSTPGKVTHVGIALGGGGFIHASGWVRINSLDQGSENFSQRHVDTFTSVNRYIEQETP